MKWLRLYSDVVSDPKVQRLSGDQFKSWINALCIASQHDGILPPVADLAFTLRITENRVAALLGELTEKGLLDVTEPGRYTPHNWASRQYKSDVSKERVQRHRERRRNVTVTSPDTDNRNRTERVTGDGGLIEVTDEAALAAWDRFGRETQGKPYPRNRHGGWYLPSQWPPMHAISGSGGAA